MEPMLCPYCAAPMRLSADNTMYMCKGADVVFETTIVPCYSCKKEYKYVRRYRAEYHYTKECEDTKPDSKDSTLEVVIDENNKTKKKRGK